MIFHYAGKFDGNESSLPQREHPANSVPFKEPKNMKKLAIIGNIGAIVVILILAIPYIILGKEYIKLDDTGLLVGSICSLLTMIPHEFLHAVCFKEDVYMYTNLNKGMLFVVGTEAMSKMRFIVMSLLPNIVFGLIPYLVFLIRPQLIGVGMLGAICVGMGFGDYINVYNALTQMPKGAKTYLCGMHSFWYMPK